MLSVSKWAIIANCCSRLACRRTRRCGCLVQIRFWTVMAYLIPLVSTLGLTSTYRTIDCWQRQHLQSTQLVSRKSIVAIIDQLEAVMNHNFFPALVVLGTALALHYTTILDICFYCLVPLVFKGPGTGNSTELRCGLSLLGCMSRCMFSKGTKEKYASLSCTSTLLLMIDDPCSQSTISDFVISLYKGAYEGTVAWGQD